MSTPLDPAAPNQVRVRAVFVPDAVAVSPELLAGMRGAMRIPAELVIDSAPEEPGDAE
jgi:hypothetical protein